MLFCFYEVLGFLNEFKLFTCFFFWFERLTRRRYVHVFLRDVSWLSP